MALGSLRRHLSAAVGGRARRRVVVVFAAVLALDTADKGTLGAVAGELKPELHSRNTELGVLAAATAAASALATVPMGMLADRVTRVKLLALSVTFWSVAMAWSASAGSFQMLLLSRTGLGVVLAAAGPVVASLIGDFFAPHERGTIYGYILSGDLIGSGFGFLVSRTVAGALSWRFSFALLAAAGVALAWTVWRKLPEPERGGQGRLSTGADSFRETLPAPPRAHGRHGLAERAVHVEEIEPVHDLVLDEDPARMGLGRALRYVLRMHHGRGGRATPLRAHRRRTGRHRPRA
jgi:MFS family permease